MRKKLFSTCTLLLALCLAAPIQTAEAKKKPKRQLVGIWQAIQNEQPKLSFKKLSADGTFCNFRMTKQDGTFNFWQQGKYKVTSDSTCVEYIEESPFVEHQYRESQLKFHLSKNGKRLQIEWFDPRTKEWIPKTWIKME